MMSVLTAATLVLAAHFQVPESAPRNAAAHHLGADRLALAGYDPVAYFDEGGAAATKGSTEWSLDHAGVVYRFASEAHRTLFAAEPGRFEPAHGGWCSFAMSRKQKVAVDPQAFRVWRDRLFLFAHPRYLQVDGPWVEDEGSNVDQADAHWKQLSGEAPRRGRPDRWRPYEQFHLTQDSLALEGFDPVTYVPEFGGQPQPGLPGINLRHRGVLYRFASDAHRAAFAADPTRFEPQHGGWCSYAMGANGDKVEVDPKAFRLTNGRLHLFYNSLFNDTRKDWDRDTAALKTKADANWGRVVEAASAVADEAAGG